MYILRKYIDRLETYKFNFFLIIKIEFFIINCYKLCFCYKIVQFITNFGISDLTYKISFYSL
jgi:hypothetical protein